ncbi:SRPBCC family protein [Actinocrispum sp. NPDC049592]|uniref:SRPBCC family protein n=1 Tax=Actinocrispum sp. NPDC049592 TaxID=3154835 RepID=UPI00343B6EFB
MNPSATGQILVSAPPDRVYALISDLAGLCSVAEETTRATILGGGTSVSVGTRFRGRNKRGVFRWATTSTVTDASPGTRFAFDVTSLGVPVSRWQYDIEPAEGGCVVTESTWDRRPAWFYPIALLGTGVTDRVAVNTANIARTLQRLKDKAESA